MATRPMRLIIALVVIVASASLLSVISYQYSTSVAGQIDQLARSEVRSSALAQTQALSDTLESRLDEVADNLQLLSVTPAIRSGDLQSIRLLMDTSQLSTNDITDAYVLMGQDGKVIWSTFFERNDALAATGVGLDLSERPYFSLVRDTHQPYSHILRSTDNVTRMHFSYPVLEPASDGSRQFQGAVAAAFRLDVIGAALEARDKFSKEGRITIVDSEGTLIVGSEEFIGMNYFTDEFQSKVFPQIIPLNSKDTWHEAVTDAVMDSGSGTFDVNLYGEDVTIAYAPVFLKDEHLMTLFYRVPHNLASEYAVLADQERTSAILIIVVIGAIATGISFSTLSWDRALRRIVDERTKALSEKTRQLESKTAELEHLNENIRLANEKLSVAYEDLKKHDKMQVEFVNIAAHELRTPIQPILVIAELLKDALDGKQEAVITETDVNILARNADRLQKLSLEILDATRIESGTLRLSMEEMDINEKLINVIKDTESLIPEGEDIRIELNVETDASGNAIPMKVRIDRLRIFQVLSNLIRNAIKYSRLKGDNGKGVITITAKKSPDDREVIVSVGDKGVGIDPDLLPSLFGKFAVDKERGGAGLGLFLAKNIIEAHGGKIWAENNKDGRGATFYFTLQLQPGLETS